MLNLKASWAIVLTAMAVSSACEEESAEPQSDIGITPRAEIIGRERELPWVGTERLPSELSSLPCDRLHWVGNKWWAESITCSPDEKLSVLLYVESVDLGFNVSVSVQSTTCVLHETSMPSAFRLEDPNFFEMSEDRQQAWLVAGVTRIIDDIGSACGGPYDADEILTPQFRQNFADIAERYWRNYDAAFMQQKLRETQQAVLGPT